MNFVNIDSIEAAKCLQLFEDNRKPFTAVDIATRLHIGGNRETQRRHVRAIVELLRDKGHHICANLSDGYFLTPDEKTWRDYLERRQIDAKQILGETGRQKKTLIDREGQGFLFVPNPALA